MKPRKFRTMEEVDEYLSGSRIECLICGGMYRSLAPHLWHAHGTTARDYKITYGIPVTRGLVVEDVSFALSQARRLEYSCFTQKEKEEHNLYLTEIRKLKRCFVVRRPPAVVDRLRKHCEVMLPQANAKLAELGKIDPDSVYKYGWEYLRLIQKVGSNEEASRRLGISPHYVRQWIKNSPEFRYFYEAVVRDLPPYVYRYRSGGGLGLSYDYDLNEVADRILRYALDGHGKRYIAEKMGLNDKTVLKFKHDLDKMYPELDLFGRAKTKNRETIRQAGHRPRKRMVCPVCGRLISDHAYSRHVQACQVREERVR